MKLLEIIDRTFIGRIVSAKLDVVINTNPDRIYVENIRSFFGVSHGIAKFLCESAVHQGIFKKKIALVCPNEECERIIDSFDYKVMYPETVTCRNCELHERDEYEFTTSSINKIVYYQLIKNNG